MGVDVGRSLTIPGWMGEEELRWLAERAAEVRHGCVAEVGCWQGRSTVALAEHAGLGTTVLAVDHFRGGPEHNEELATKPESWLWDRFAANTADLRKQGRINVMRLPSADAAKLLALRGWKVDVAFIDAAHEHESVRADILAWKPLVVKGGLLAGHDFSPSWPGVVQAVRELCPGFALVEPRERCAIWHVRC